MRSGGVARAGQRRSGWTSWPATTSFLRRLDELAADLDNYLTRPLWYQQQADEGVQLPNGIAYFSMEFGVAEVLPNYSGGLGILAGDHLKSASDLGLPLIAVGSVVPLGILPAVADRGRLAARELPVAGSAGPAAAAADRQRRRRRCWWRWRCRTATQLRARVWIAQVGRIPLLLLDSDIPENEHDLRSVTDRLYGGDQEHRIKQEILAGIGGVRAIRAFTEIEGLPAPEVFHMNEGHAGFLGVERIRELIDAGLDFDTALTVVRSSTVFTTHTPVPAGIDRFPVEMVKRYFGGSTDGPSGAMSRLLPGVPLDRDHRVRRRGRPVEVQHGPHGPAAGAARQRGVAAARAGQPRHVQRAVAGIRPATRCRSARSPTACTARPGRRRSGWSWAASCSAAKISARSANPTPGSGCSRSTPGTCGGSARSCARLWSRTCGPGYAARGWSVAHRTPNWAGSQRLSIPMC